jgi:hypothetical protein
MEIKRTSQAAGVSALSMNGVDLIIQKDGTEDYVFISRESWDEVCGHLIETNLHPEWSYARQLAFGSSNMTAHKPRGLIVSQRSLGLGGPTGTRVRIARLIGRPIYVELVLEDESTVWERWS